MEATTIAGAAVSGLVREVMRAAAERLKNHLRTNGRRAIWSESALASHLQWVASWSSGIQIAQMSRAEAIEDRTIQLGFFEADVGLRLVNNGKEIDGDILGDDENYLIFGDPGGGKTTAIKQICRRLFTEAAHASDRWQYPILILLRNLPKGQGLIVQLGRILGLQFETPPNVELRHLARSTMCGNESLFDLVTQSLSASQAVLLIDGIDELDPKERIDIELEIQELIHSTRCKMLLTARTGSVTRTYESITCVELRPLTGDQQQQIARRWIGNESEFFAALRRRPYADLANRPLFLVRLLLLFKRDGILPYQPCDVYERFVRLLLEDWDRERDILRLSRYGNFGPDQKLRFLAALANHLLIGTHSVGFDRLALERGYVVTCEQFELPPLQAEQVVREIISHTGLIVQSGFDTYEFSHLSLQEYLCAYHMIRDPLNSTTKAYLEIYPAPLAIAASMSADPSGFMALVVLSAQEPAGEYEHIEAARNWNVFLRRLAYECPKMAVGYSLGVAALKLTSEFPELENSVFTAVGANNDDAVLLKSIAKALSAYELRASEPEKGMLQLCRVADLELPTSLRQPEQLNLSVSLFSRISQRLGIGLPLSGSGRRELVVSPEGKMQIRHAARWRPQPEAGNEAP